MSKAPHTQLPEGNQLTAQDEHYRNHMHDVLDLLREVAPVYKDNVFQRYVVTKHDAITKIFRNSTVCGRDWEVAAEGTWGKTVSPRNGKFGMVDEDGDKHKRLRGLVSKTFTAKAALALKPKLDQIADDLIARLKDRESFDFIRELAAPLPTIIMAEVLGVEKKDQEKFKRWSEEWVYICDPDISPEMLTVAREANANLENYFAETVKARLAEPKDDLISRLLHEVDEGNKLTPIEVATICLQLIVAGNITSTDLIGNGLVALLQNPEQLEKLRAHPELMDKAVEEMLRFDAPVTEIPRFCYEAVEVSGQKIDKGQTLTLSLTGGNHDPAAYKCPHKFDIEREGPAHHAFGGGIHYCLGVHLARIEISVTFTKLLNAFPVLKLAEQKLERKAVPTFSGYKRVMVTTR
ncbi:cytochrome P450 [Archangium violaceum]|uniref:cytochrome P450 n=1 Tax=Archangium violaceum TaxID=83451 RepID=UPI0019526398|nr:cytochrome P450 [Archangium violaceum]QRN93152.1 cytochrome P450 [Archangium violaceum]UQK84947.1 hypothetical protein [Archangium gephyra]